MAQKGCFANDAGGGGGSGDDDYCCCHLVLYHCTILTGLET
jgi:hypothetical protein